MIRLNPAKLLLSKWTAAHPQNREKHFLVTEVFLDEAGTVVEIELQAVLTRRNQRMNWRMLKNRDSWTPGWQ